MDGSTLFPFGEEWFKIIQLKDMNILIITNVFHPSDMIGAFRINAFARYFSRAGHDVTVVAEGAEDGMSYWEGCRIRYVRDPVIRDFTRKVYDYALGPKWSLHRIVKGLEVRLTLNASYFWCVRALKTARRLMSQRHYDVLLSTYSYDVAPHFCAFKLKKEYPGIFWIADFREELSFPVAAKWNIPQWYSWQLRRLKDMMKKVLDMSDLILSVSKPIVDDFKLLSSHGRVLEIRNGYDYPEVYETYFQERFTMMYLGHFYKDIHPDNLLCAYKDLIAEGYLPADCLIKIVGNHERIAIPDVLRSNVVELPKVTHDEAVRMSIEESDVLLMIYSRCAGRKGVYSGKLLDYLATNKPILAICDTADVVGDLMHDTCAGYAVDEDDIPAIKEAIKKCYDLWLNKRVLPRNWNKIKEFRRSNQVGILLDYLAENIPDRG